jgi:flagellin-like hook-associated protein FlgL
MSDIVERLRSADVLIVKSATDLRSVVAEEAAAEIEKLRAALRKIADTDPDEGTSWFHDVANAALGEKK